MSHLVCDTHGSRSMVLQNGDVIHRNGQRCQARIVWWGEKDFVSFDVPSIGGLSTADDKAYAQPFDLDKFHKHIEELGGQLVAKVHIFNDAVKNAGVTVKKFTDAFQGVIPFTMPSGQHIGTATVEETEEGLVAHITPNEDEATKRLLNDIFSVPELFLAKCPVCGADDAVMDKSQDSTIYCDNCQFMGQDIQPPEIKGIITDPSEYHMTDEEFMGRDSLSVSLRAQGFTEGEIAEMVKRSHASEKIIPPDEVVDYIQVDDLHNAIVVEDEAAIRRLRNVMSHIDETVAGDHFPWP